MNEWMNGQGSAVVLYGVQKKKKEREKAFPSERLWEIHQILAKQRSGAKNVFPFCSYYFLFCDKGISFLHYQLG